MIPLCMMRRRETRDASDNAPVPPVVGGTKKCFCVDGRNESLGLLYVTLQRNQRTTLCNTLLHYKK